MSHKLKLLPLLSNLCGKHQSKNIHTYKRSGKLVQTNTFSRVRTVIKPSLFTPSSWNLVDRLLAKFGIDLDYKMDLFHFGNVKGMEKLDKSAFSGKVMIPSLEVPYPSIATVNKLFKKKVLKRPGVNHIADIREGNVKQSGKIFLFDPAAVKGVDDFTEEERQNFAKLDIDISTFKMYGLELSYRNFNHTEILKAVLPESCDWIAGYSNVGHIVHLNLKEDNLKYKSIIGEVLLDKIPTAETVVNKLDSIDNTFRTFQMEVLAGKEDFITIAKENGISFKMDFSKVYWNSRLGTEHLRIISMLKKDDIVYDVFAGIGPFSIPAAKKKCSVFANDLNPESFKWLNENITLNKVKPEFIKTHNMDGRDFIKSVIKDHLHSRMKEGDERMTRIMMNLPALAIEFLDTFIGLYEDVSEDSIKCDILPHIHCYCFTKVDKQEVLDRVNTILKTDMDSSYCEVRVVRRVAPNKDMMCVSFQMPKEVLYRGKCEDTEEPPAKKLCS